MSTLIPITSQTPVYETMCRTHPALAPKILCLFAFINADNATDKVNVNEGEINERIITVVPFVVPIVPTVPLTNNL